MEQKHLTWVELDQPGAAVTEVSAHFGCSVLRLHKSATLSARPTSASILWAEPPTWMATKAGSALVPLRWIWIRSSGADSQVRKQVAASWTRDQDRSRLQGPAEMSSWTRP